MLARIASDLDCEEQCINLKATTHEGLGSLGRCEGLAAQAIVLLAHADASKHGR
jgi:2-C-methyl-D-erythritol 2,4-cyclodiphosphate synthase